MVLLSSAIALLAGFVKVAGAGVGEGSSDAEFGSAMGQGLAFVLIVWAIAHFVFIRKTSKRMKLISAGAIVGSGILGCVFGILI